VSTSSNGAHALLEAAQTVGTRVCFANPGTTELALVRALDNVPAIKPVLGLFEGVCTGAADGYARVSGKPALTLLHLGPGLANGLANLHNARRAHSPVINIVGDHATWHVKFDAPLTSDIESLARPMSGRVIRLHSSASIIPSMREAVSEAKGPPGQVITLIAPSDLMEKDHVNPMHWQPSVDTQADSPQPVPTQQMLDVAAKLREGRPTVILLGSEALSARGQQAARRVANCTGARLIMESYPAILPLGGDLPQLERLAYFPDDVIQQLGGSEVLLAGARAPVSYFGYEGHPSKLVAESRLIELSSPGEDSALALEQLAESLHGARGHIQSLETVVPQQDHRASLSPVAIATALVEQVPEGAIVSLEGSSCGGPYLQRAHRARRHRVMTNTGGAIGQGLPCALGAAVAEPESRVICLQSDGSAQYTVQALWTMAREGLNITVIISANHRYGILQTELKRARADLDALATARLTTLDSPRVDWLALARGYGVPGSRITTTEEFRQALSIALKMPGPYLIEAQLV
jgi:acetolactate synthase I/II/III large subunit